MNTKDIQIENRALKPKDVLMALSLIYKNKRFQRPESGQLPRFSTEEVGTLADYIFFKPPYIEIRACERLPQRREIPLKRRLFIHYLLYGDAKFNGAKAARMAGYSPRSAKQIAYKLKRS